MSLERIEAEVRRLLASNEPEVICISGEWGVGKTYAWREYLKQAKKRESGFAMAWYSYVSLFGMNSLDDLRYEIFANKVGAADIGVEPTVEMFKSNWQAVSKQWSKSFIPLLQHLPKVKPAVGLVGPLGYRFLSKTVVCIDDIERRGEKLTIREVLGLVSQLKEQKKCKVIIILNDNALSEERDKADWLRHGEKVIDVRLSFAPTALESASIALKQTPSPLDDLLQSHCVTLGITNIRVIMRIERAVRQVAPLLEPYDEAVLRQVVHSLVLLGWSHLEPDKAPPLEYLKNLRPQGMGSRESSEKSLRESAWDALLYVYQFHSFDKLDQALLEYVCKGYYIQDDILKYAKEIDDQTKREARNSDYGAAWDAFHNSFEDDAEAVTSNMYIACLDNLLNISLPDMDGTIRLMKSLGKRELAKEIIAKYVDCHKYNTAVLDRNNHIFGDSIQDPDLIEALDMRLKEVEYEEDRHPSEILISIPGGWNPEDITRLNALSVEDFRQVFKQAKGKRLGRMIAGALQFNRIANASSDCLAISSRAMEALKLIGAESPINAMRVKKYGINVEGVGQSPTGETSSS